MNNIILLALGCTGFAVIILANVSAFVPSTQSKPNFIYSEKKLIAY